MTTSRERIIAALPGTLDQIQAETGLSYGAVNSELKRLCLAEKARRIGVVRSEKTGKFLTLYDRDTDYRLRQPDTAEPLVSYAMRSQPALARVWA